MKLKENKGMSLIVFTIILAVLLVVAGGVIIYLLNNPLLNIHLNLLYMLKTHILFRFV